MNYRMVLFVLGRILGVEAVLMLLPLFTAVIYGENVLPFIIPIAILIGISVGLSIKPPRERVMHAKDGFVCVGLSWIVMSLFGALPFVIGGEISSYIDAFFETVSGFTTTGASILSDVESMSSGMLIWRSFTHWIGGMGILVFVLAIMPQSDKKNSRFMHLMRAESPGPSVGKIVPKISETSRIMYGIYIVLTVLLALLLYAGGMPLFDTLCHTFGTAGTGGFGIKNDSIASYSPFCQYVMATFMILFGINFNVYYFLLIRQFFKAIKSEELWTYLSIIAVSVGVISFSVYGFYNLNALSGFIVTAEESFRMAYFQVASIISTSGFSTVNFDLWPSLTHVILVILMFTGASAGCTGGGIKVSRIILLAKNAAREIKYILNPRIVKNVKFEGKRIDHETIRGTTSYLIVYIAVFTLSLIAVIAAEGCDLVSGFTSIAACINNIGPGLSKVGPSSNFGWMTDFSKIVLCFNMLAGRLELFPILILFSPSTWKKFM